MNFKQLEFFRKTAELENISKAAKELFIAQPALSKAIKDLENELGYTLFDRIGKQIQLNQNGEILYKHVLHLQYDFSHMENELREANAQKSGSIHVSFRVSSSLLPAILQSFYAKYPDSNLKVYQINQVPKSLPEFDVIMIRSLETIYIPIPSNFCLANLYYWHFRLLILWRKGNQLYLQI